MTSFVKLNDTDGSGNPYTMDMWAEETLSEDEFYNFLRAKARQDAIIGQALDDGTLITEDVYETVRSETLQEEVKIRVGTRLTIKEGHIIEGDPEFLEFEARYAKDPKVIYRPVAN